jgi:hypothetical protein
MSHAATAAQEYSHAVVVYRLVGKEHQGNSGMTDATEL